MAKAIREAYGEALAKYGAINKNVVVLDADVSGSTKSALFKAVAPERFFNVGVAEANMVGMAAGFSAAGYIPFVNTFAVFLTTLGLLPIRAFASYSNANIKLAGGYSGLSDSFDGPTHHALEDIAIMRTMPNVRVFVASDVVMTDWLTKHAIDTPGPVYLRLSREAMSDIYEPGTTFEEGRGKLLLEGSDVTLVGCGIMTGVALEAAKLLKNEGISAAVVDMFSVKPIDLELLAECAKRTGAIVTAEEHNVIGGLGGAVSEALHRINALVPLGFVGVDDRHAECGPYGPLLAKYGLDAATLASKAKETIALK